MATTRFQLTTEGQQFAQEGVVRLRVAFTGTSEGVTRYYGQRSCPILEISTTDVIQTTDDWASSNLTQMHVPTNTYRQGAAKEAGPMFEDVTGSTTEGDVDVDLDPIFDTVRGV
jgi:hypothetical protein